MCSEWVSFSQATYGGLGMGVCMALPGAQVAWVSEIDAAPSRILKARLGVPNLGDITRIDWTHVEPVDVLTGGFPCQDVSIAGARAGIGGGTRSGLWSEFVRAIDALRPGLVVIENVRGLLSARAERGAHVALGSCELCMADERADDLRALGAVLGDLAELGLDAEWGVLAASSVGAPHRRERVFVVAWPVADADGDESERWRVGGVVGGSPVAYEGACGEREWVRDAIGDCGEAVHLMPTPEANLGTRGGAQDPVKRREGGHSVSLADAVHLLPTPTTEPTTGNGRARNLGAEVKRFGEYAEAVERWERVLGRRAPDPTEVGPRGGQRLAPRFVEWLMGLPEGHVTGVDGVSRPEELKALGNGVVPLQAAFAVRALLDRAAVAA